jgi:serralysin
MCPGVLLLGAAGWETIPVAATPGGGAWTVANTSAGQFPGWAAQSGVRAVTGNFSGAGGPADVALLGGHDWNTMPVALSNATGTYWTVSNQPAGGFSLWAAEPGVTVLTGDFGKTGKTAIALTGGASWDMMPLALSNGDGTWEITNVGVAPYSNSEFPGWAAQPGVTAVAGDFSLAGTGQAAIALVGGQGWNTIPLAFALAGSNGTWMTTNQPAGDFPGWAAQPGVKVVTGKFSDSGLTDIALIGGPGWTTIPMAVPAGGGNWTVFNNPAGGFPGWAALPNVVAYPVQASSPI